MARVTSTDVKRSVGAYRKLPFFFFQSQGEEFLWPIDGSQQLFSLEEEERNGKGGGQASGKKLAGRSRQKS